MRRRDAFRAPPGPLALLAAGLLAWACDGGGGSGPVDTTPPPPPDAARITVSLPEEGVTTIQGGPGAVEPSAQVRVTNTDASDRAGGSVATTVTADGEGTFRATLPADLGDDLALVAIDAAGNESPPTTISAGPEPASLVLRPVSQETQTGVVGRPLVDPLQVEVTAPPFDDAVPRVTVLFEVRAGGGSLSEVRVETDDGGVATTRYTLGPGEGANEVAARLEIAPEKEILFDASAVGAPRIDSVDPARGEPGEEVVIRGANFSPIARHDVVTFGDEAAPVLEASPTRLSVEVPMFATEGPVAVSLTGVSSNATRFDVVPVVVEAPPLGDVELVTFELGDGRIELPFESATQEYTLVVQALQPRATTFQTVFTGSGAALAARGALVTAGQPTGIVGESIIRRLDRRTTRKLTRSGVGRGALAPAQESCPIEPGSTCEFWVLNQAGLVSINDPDNFDRITARLRFIDERTLVYVDERVDASTLPSGQVAEIGGRFDDQIQPTNIGAFGEPSDVDGNGRVIVVLSPTVNSLTTQSLVDQGGRIVGFFFGGLDLLFDPDDPSTNPHSNRGEIFYGVVPDPDRSFGAARVTLEEYSPLLASVMAHEFEHMISFNQHVLVRGGSPEALWLDEGLAHMAEELNGLRLQNRLRAAFFLQFPRTTPLVVGGNALDERGAAWLFVNHLVDRFGEPVLGRLVQTFRTSLPNVTAATGEEFPLLFHAWATTLALDGTGLAPEPRFEMPSVDLRREFEAAKELLNSDPTRPPPITGGYLDVRDASVPIGSSEDDRLEVRQTGTSAAYVRVTSPGRTNAEIEVDGPAGAQLQITVVRTK